MEISSGGELSYSCSGLEGEELGQQQQQHLQRAGTIRAGSRGTSQAYFGGGNAGKNPDT